MKDNYWMAYDILNAAIAKVRLSRMGWKKVNRAVRLLRHAKEYLALCQVGVDCTWFE